MLWSHSILKLPPSPFPATEGKTQVPLSPKDVLKAYAGRQEGMLDYQGHTSQGPGEGQSVSSGLNTTGSTRNLYRLPKPTCCCLRPD